MGAGSSVDIMPLTTKRWKRKKMQRQHKSMVADILERYDASSTGTLSKKEVRDLAESILGQTHTAVVGGLTDDDFDLIMRLGGANCKPELEAADLPAALSLIVQIKEADATLYSLFEMCDTDHTGGLSRNQLTAFLTMVNDDKPVQDSDVDYVFTQCSTSGDSNLTVARDELKAALACWYVINPTAGLDTEPEPDAEAEGPAAAPAAAAEARAPAIAEATPEPTKKKPAAGGEKPAETKKPAAGGEKPAETKKPEARPAETKMPVVEDKKTKPAEAKKAEAKPAETKKPAADDKKPKPAETKKPVADDKKSKPAETKKPAADDKKSKPAETKKPAADDKKPKRAETKKPAADDRKPKPAETKKAAAATAGQHPKPKTKPA